MDVPAGSSVAHYRGAARRMPALRAVGLCLVLSMLAACGGQQIRLQSRSAQAEPNDALDIVDVPANDPSRANDVLIRAIGLVGVPYRWGGNTPESGFDCSGLVNFVFRDIGGVALPRTAHEIAALPVPQVRDYRLAPADLVFFGDAHGCASAAGAGCAGAAHASGVSHVGIYVGQGRFVHAPNSGGTVRLDRLDNIYWREHYLGAERVLR